MFPINRGSGLHFCFYLTYHRLPHQAFSFSLFRDSRRRILPLLPRSQFFVLFQFLSFPSSSALHLPLPTIPMVDDRIDRCPQLTGPRGEDGWYYPLLVASSEMEIFQSSDYDSTGDRLVRNPIETEAIKHRSNVTRLRAAEYHHLIHAPRILQMRNCTRFERICSAPVDGWLPICAEYFRVGLRFPIPQFILDVLASHNIAINQLTPNAMRYLIAFMSKCILVGIEPTVDLFHCFMCATTESNVTSATWGYVGFNHRVAYGRILGGCPSRNAFYKERYLFVRNHPDEPPLEFPVRWGQPVGTRGSRAAFPCNHPSVVALSKFAIRDATILCSPELTAYLGIFPRQLTNSMLSCFIIFFYLCVAFYHRLL